MNSVRVILANGDNIELFDADYKIHFCADGTPSDIEISNTSARFIFCADRVEVLGVIDKHGNTSAYMRADRATLGRTNTGDIWGWYNG